MSGANPRNPRPSSFERALEMMVEDDEEDVLPELTELLAREPGLAHAQDENGWTLLHHAIKNCHFSFVAVLLDHGADPNAATNNDQSALGLCGGVDDDEQQCRAALLAKGAKRTRREEVLQLIREGRDEEVIDLFTGDPGLMNAGHPTLGPYLHVAARFGQAHKVLQFLLAQGMDPNVLADDRETALHGAYRNPGAVRILIDHGADINAQDDQGYTPLHYAVGHYQDETATLLVEAGADLNLRTEDGETVLDFVFETRFPGYRQFARYLKSKGAKHGKSFG